MFKVMFLFAFMHAHNRSVHWPTALTFCSVLAYVSLMCCIKSLVSRTCVLYSVHTFLHQSPNSVVDRVFRSTGLFGRHRSGEKIWCFLRKWAELFHEHWKFGERAFAVAAPRVWNTLSTDLKSQRSTTSFKRSLKTVLFNRAFSSQTA